MKISRHVMNEDGHTSSVRDKILSIRVKKGWKQGTRITFPEEGDQGPNTIPADIGKFTLRKYPTLQSTRLPFLPNIGHFCPTSNLIRHRPLLTFISPRLK